jgi:hypothetical protein
MLLSKSNFKLHLDTAWEARFMKAIFTVRSDLVGRAITLIDGGYYNHCGIYDPAVDNRGGYIIEANPFEGVRRRLLGPILSESIGFAILELAMPREEMALEWLHQQVGLSYDWLGLLGLAFGVDWTHGDKWVCAPLTLMTFIQAGATLDGGPQPRFDYVAGVREAYEILEKLGAKITTSYHPRQGLPLLPRQ